MKNRNVVYFLSELVSVDTQSTKNNKPIIDLLKAWFVTYQYKTEHWVRHDGVKGENLIIKIPGKRSHNSLVFVGHTDTVPTNENWDTGPFMLQEDNGKLYGLGACDAKGGIAALLTAVFSLEEIPAYDTYLVFDGDEEATTTGIKTFIKSFPLQDSHFIFIEPTENLIAIGQRSILQLVITTHGTATHSSQATPENNKKDNAIYKMQLIMNMLAKDARLFTKERDDIFGISTQNFGVIHGGTAMNVFADACTLVLERRLLPQKNLHQEFLHITQIVKNIDKNANVLLNESLPSFSVSHENPFAKNILSFMKQTIPTATFGIFPAWSEAGLLANKSNVVVLGPGSLVNQAHRANEYVEKKELLDFVGIYKGIIETINLS